MRVARILYRNILFHEELDLRPGKITKAVGRNACGKTSFIEPLLALRKGGYDATLLRQGAEEGEIVFVVNDETGVINGEAGDFTWTQEYRPDKRMPLKLTGPNGKDEKKAKTILDDILDALSSNPIAWLLKPEDEQTRALLETIDLRVSAADFLAAGIDCAAEGIPDLSGHGLQVLDRVRDHLYKARHGIGVLRDQNRKTVTKLTNTLPPERPDIEADLEAKRKAASKLDAAVASKHETERANHTARLADIAAAYSAALAVIEKTHTDAVAATHEEFNAGKHRAESSVSGKLRAKDKEIADLEMQLQKLRSERQVIENGLSSHLQMLEKARDAEIATHGQSRASDTAAAEAKKAAEENQCLADAKDVMAKFRASQAAERESLAADIARMEEEFKAQVRREQAMVEIQTFHAEAEEQDAEYKRLTVLLDDALTALSEKLLDKLPITGLKMQGGVLHKDGWPIGRLNAQKRVFLSMSVAKARKTKLKAMCIDGLEQLDAPMFAAFEKAALEMPEWQFFYTRVMSTCKCGHPFEVHEPKCLVGECACEAYSDPGLVITTKGQLAPETTHA